MSPLAPSLEAFFTDRLASQRAARKNTIAAYGLKLRLLLQSKSARNGIPPRRLASPNLGPQLGATVRRQATDAS